jgi:hypothetical protein
MTALCKKNFKIGSSTKFVKFLQDHWYEYTIEIHEETGTKIYYIDGQPMLERTFRSNFDDLQKRREDKLKSIGI